MIKRTSFYLSQRHQVSKNAESPELLSLPPAQSIHTLSIREEGKGCLTINR